MTPPKKAEKNTQKNKTKQKKKKQKKKQRKLWQNFLDPHMGGFYNCK